MRRFARLYAALDASTGTDAKVDALVRYLDEAPAADAAWAVYMLAGGRPRQLVPRALLMREAARAAALPDWLFEEGYHVVGDLAETIAHVLPPPLHPSDLGLATWMTERLLPLRGRPEAEVVQALHDAWAQLGPDERFLYVKLIGGAFRVGVSRLLVQRALARHAGLDAKLVAQRMVGFTDLRRVPTAAALDALRAPAGADADARAREAGLPYPFYLAHPLEPGADTPQAVAQRLGDPSAWLAEWKYDGIRAQVVRRDAAALGDGAANGVWIWSRGEELMEGRFPELEAAAQALPPGTVLDGELLVWHDGAPMPAPFQQLQTRLQRKTVTRRHLQEAPATFVAYDLLEDGGLDVRAAPLAERRARLEALAGTAAWPRGWRVSPRLTAEGDSPGDTANASDVDVDVEVDFEVEVEVERAGTDAAAPGWAAWAALRATSRARGVEGLMLKPLAGPYGVGRTKSEGGHGWWKWKIEPLHVDAVLIYAQAGHGRRAGLYTDYTFALWNRAPRDADEAAAVVRAIERREPPRDGALQLVAFAKAYSGLSDEEFAQVDRWVRARTVETFGPVRAVSPALVVELGFEGVQPSPRHKSGLAVRFPRMLRLRHDKPLHEADTLPQLQRMVAPRGA